jgi:hypothetical protein
MKGKGGTRNASSRSSRTLRFQSELYDFCSKDYEDLIHTWKEIRKWITSHSNERLAESAQFKGSGGAVALHMLSKNCAPLDIMEIVIDANRDALKLVDNFGWLVSMGSIALFLFLEKYHLFICSMLIYTATSLCLSSWSE